MYVSVTRSKSTHAVCVTVFSRIQGFFSIQHEGKTSCLIINYSLGPVDAAAPSLLVPTPALICRKWYWGRCLGEIKQCGKRGTRGDHVFCGEHGEFVCCGPGKVWRRQHNGRGAAAAPVAAPVPTLSLLVLSARAGAIVCSGQSQSQSHHVG